MTNIVGARKNIQEEEVRYKSSVSEAVGFKLGASINFINERQYDTKAFYLNGPYWTRGAPQYAVDGAICILFDCEIVGCAMFNMIAGTSGTTTLDIRRYTASNTPSGGASIFSTKPSISYNAGNYAFVFKRFSDNQTLENPSWTTLPVLSTTNLDAGDMLVADLLTTQNGAENCGVILFVRPR
jgi:hypothetical protein